MRDTVKLAVRLMAFAMVAALLLAVVNAFTAGRIERNTREKINAARREVIGDYVFEEADADISGAKYITGVYRAKDGEECAGYVYELESRGYGGTIYLCLGIDSSGAVTGVKVSSHVETKGLGTEAEGKFMADFNGMNASAGAALQVDGISGATISSNAVINAVDEALAHYDKYFAQEAVAQ